VWDAPVRLFHWATVVLLAACYASFRLDRMDWHVWTGEALLALLLFRVLWGVFGSETARFTHFLARPGAAVRHLVHLHRREPDHQIGHNAAGGWMVLVMILLLLGQTLTGLYINNDIVDEGPLTEVVPAPVADVINDLHAILWDALLAAIALHLIAILTYAVAKRHNLVWPMITGHKRLPDGTAAPHMAPLVRAGLLLAAASAVTAVLAARL
ncbi:MAG TPA: cytochrome b/b6 domain-containing protein, partial [Acetobacteraceae bacterium]|nr:cytochrome b/b6 domain-containing protein [Acetobacteraceae bacterium]